MVQVCAREFLIASDGIYTECAQGVATLDRIIVGTPASLADIARTALLPALYAYWERFFRLVFGEFLRCSSLAKEPLEQRNEQLSKLRLRKEVKSRVDERSHLLDVVDVAELRRRLASAREALVGIEGMYGLPLQFVDPEKWLQLDANIRYEVLSANCKQLGLDAGELKAMLLNEGVHLFPLLKELVDTRNDIAHGHKVNPIGSAKWEELRTFTLSLMNAVQMYLYAAIGDVSYMLRS